MNLLDLFWNFNQDNRLLELKKESVDTQERLEETITLLAEENRELHIRVSVLIRLLIEKGVLQASEYATLLKDAEVTLPPSFPPRPSDRRR